MEAQELQLRTKKTKQNPQNKKTPKNKIHTLFLP